MLWRYLWPIDQNKEKRSITNANFRCFLSYFNFQWCFIFRFMYFFSAIRRNYQRYTDKLTSRFGSVLNSQLLITNHCVAIVRLIAAQYNCVRFECMRFHYHSMSIIICHTNRWITGTEPIDIIYHLLFDFNSEIHFNWKVFHTWQRKRENRFGQAIKLRLQMHIFHSFQSRFFPLTFIQQVTADEKEKYVTFDWNTEFNANHRMINEQTTNYEFM